MKMNDRYLFKGKEKESGKWIKWNAIAGIPHGVIILSSTICQCTGLKDKNGKLIWENDIIDRKEPKPEIVKYKDGDWTIDYSYAYNMKTGNSYCNLGFYAQERKCVEVIGNIFDNPELLMSNAEALNQYIKELFDYWDGKNDDFEPIQISKEVDDEMQKDSFY